MKGTVSVFLNLNSKVIFNIAFIIHVFNQSNFIFRIIINYNNNAEKENGTCYFTTISDILNGSYLGQIVITGGVISDYFDVTPYGGPHSITIAEESSGSIVELSIWPNDWTNELKQFVEPPFFKKEIKVRGTVGEFEGTIQISPKSINIIIGRIFWQNRSHVHQFISLIYIKCARIMN